ncbi:MAG: L-glutamate gamma-semialdehyde dehydrogenase, partial [Usitatibacter sp.]
RNPAAPNDVVGEVVDADGEDVESALQAAQHATARWQATGPAERAACLQRAADQMEAEMPRLMGLVVREAGKTWSNAIAEVREAVDFLRYYARQASHFDNETHRALGTVVCISPWNFPLAIFTGQVGAALAAGNCVIAKPAEQTPLIAAQTVRLLHEGGVPQDVVQLLPGPGEVVGARLTADPRVRGVVFTGSTDVARLIQRSLAGRLNPDGRPVPLIAETGGQNAMLVDSSALAEQVVGDATTSAFDSAGQRCSALRVLCLQEEIADRVIEMLEGAMQELVLGNPERLAIDVGPVIDEPARAMLAAYVEKMREKGFRVRQFGGSEGAANDSTRGTFLSPTLIEIGRIGDLEREVFGPVLHVLRFKRQELDALVAGLNQLEYGLTLGIHSRVDETIDRVVASARVGNIYVNRNIVGAVVGVQPFGGEGLSGTGPKAGGPMYLHRFLSKFPPDAAIEELRALDESGLRASLKAFEPALAPFESLRMWAKASEPDLALLCDRLAAYSPAGADVVLPGPTGERNTYSLRPRRRVLCIAHEDRDLLMQVAAVLSVGSRAACITSDRTTRVLRMLPAEAARAVDTIALDWRAADSDFDAVMHHGSAEQCRAVLLKMAERDGPLVSVHGFNPGEEPMALERLVIERVVSVNTAAAGGNASLMTIG